MLDPVVFQNQQLTIIDQTQLPHNLVYVNLSTVEQVYQAIQNMLVRGAPAIGIAAAYGMVLACQKNNQIDAIKKAGQRLITARPTAVNLMWAVDEVFKAIEKSERVGSFYDAALEKANQIKEQDIKNNRKMGEFLLSLFGEKRNILTHCNAGILATSQYGTATAGFYLGKEKGIDFKVFADETRPRLQGASLTAYELKAHDIDVTLICDNTAGYLMSMGTIDAVVVGCDRVAKNGDIANKVGTLSLSILANHYDIPFYVCAPTSSIDHSIEHGNQIPIEQRSKEEVLKINEKSIGPKDVKAINYAFDVTPNELITAIVTENGIIHPPFVNRLGQ